MLAQELALSDLSRPTQASRVYSYLRENPNRTIEQIAIGMGIKESSVCARLNELKGSLDAFGLPRPLVEYDDRVLVDNSSGRKAGVWRVLRVETLF